MNLRINLHFFVGHFGIINVQILNCPDSFHFSGEARPSADGLGPRLAPNTSYDSMPKSPTF